MEEKRPLYTNVYIIPQDIWSGVSNPILDNLNIRHAGYYDFAKEHHTKRTSFEEYQLIYCVKGEGSLTIKGVKWAVKPGDVAICFKGLDHEYGANPENPWTIYWAHFDGKTALDFLNNMTLSPDKPVIKLSNKLQIIPYFMEIFDTLKSGYHARNLINVSVCFQHILGLIAKDQQDRYNLQGNITINSVIEFMIKNVHSSLTLTEMAVTARMSKSNFCRIFHSNIGYSPMNYFIRLKMMKACELFETTNMRVNEIANKLDYTDEYYFSRLFKNIIGSSPREYRRSNKR